jgi:hypothetical protein
MATRAEHGAEERAALAEDIRLLRRLLQPEDGVSATSEQSVFRQAVQNIIDARQSDLTRLVAELRP